MMKSLSAPSALRPSPPYTANLFIFLSVLFSVLVPPSNLLCKKSINFVLLSSSSALRPSPPMANGPVGMRRVCEKYAQSQEKRARRPCTNFASERPAGKDSETTFKRFQRVPQDSKGLRRGSKGCQTISKDSKGLERISKNFKGSQRIPTPCNP